MNTTSVRKHVAHAGFLTLLVFYTQALTAGEHSEPHGLTIYSDVAGASEILSEDYDKAIEIMLNTPSSGEARVSLLNNLCVAYTLSEQLESARTTCDHAIEEASEPKNYGDLSRKYNSARTMRRYVAQAQANRGISRTLSGDALGAALDIKPDD